MKVAAYLRVSTEDQQERGTIETQLDFLRKYVDLHQLNLVETYKDDGVSGTLPFESRPAGRQVMEGAKEKKFELLLVYKLDRLGRVARIILNSIHDFEELGVKVKSMTEPFDTSDPSGRFFVTILAGVADFDRNVILDRLWNGANRCAKAGKWLGGIVPYGYIVVDGYLAVSDDLLPDSKYSEADIVRLIFNLTVNQKMSTIKIAQYLTSLGVPPSYTKDRRTVLKGKRKEATAGIWHSSRIRNMIVSTTYKGIHQYGKRSKKEREVIEREVPALVSEEIWDKAQPVLKENYIESMRNTSRQYLLRGMIKCGICGRTYMGTPYNSGVGKEKLWYRCCGKHMRNLTNRCIESKNIEAAWIEDQVWKLCLSIIENPEPFLKELVSKKEELQNHSIQFSNEASILEEAIQGKENEKQKILDLFRRGIIQIEDVEIQIQKINTEKETLENQLKANSASLIDETKFLKELDETEDTLKKLKATSEYERSFEEKRTIIKMLVSEIVVNSKADETTGLPTINVTLSVSKDVNRTDKDSKLPPT